MTRPEVWALPSEYGAAASSWIQNSVEILSRELHPLLGSVRREKFDEIWLPEEHSPEHQEFASPLFSSLKASHELTVDARDVLNGDVDSFLTMIFQLADSFGSQITQAMMAHISNVCAINGQTVAGGGGRDFIDVMIEALEKIEISFDENGQHNLMLLVNPDTAKKLRNRRPTPAQVARIRDLLKRKKEEWDASRHRHELP